MATEVLPTSCAFDRKPLEQRDEQRRGVCAGCWKVVGKDQPKPDRKQIETVLAEAPEVLRDEWKELGNLTRADIAAKAMALGLLDVAEAVSFGSESWEVVAEKVDPSKQRIAAVFNMAKALGYSLTANRLMSFHFGAKELIRFRDAGRGAYEVHTPFNERWNALARGTPGVFLGKPFKEGDFWWRPFHNSKLREVVNMLQGVFGDAYALGVGGLIFPLPSMPLPKEDDFGEAPKGPPKASGEKWEIPPEIEGILVGDVIQLPEGGSSTVRFVDPGKRRIAVSEQPGAPRTYYSFEIVETTTGRPVAARIAAEMREAAKEVGGTAVDVPVLDREIPEAMYPYQVESLAFIEKNRRAILAEEMGLGKGVVYGTKVLTASGWRPIETLCVGDEVVDPDGGAAQVTGIFPQPKQPVFRVTMSDGASITTDAPHLWHVYSINDRFRKTDGRVMSTKELIEAGLRTPANPTTGWTNRKWFIPLTAPVVFEREEGDRSWPPYALGVLLGDGSFGSNGYVSWSKPDEEIFERMSAMLDVSRHAVMPGKCPQFTVHNGGQVTAALGLKGLPSEEKFVPRHYMTESIESRIELLRGLMDTDGDCAKEGTSIFNTSSPRLRDDVIELVRSLGGLATMYEKPEPKYTYNDEVRTGLPAYRVNVRTPFNPFHLRRKADRWRPPTLARSIDSIEPAGNAETICIKVNSKRELYVVDGHVVTHNTLTCVVAIDTPAIVVCPATLKPTWVREIGKWRPSLTPMVLTLKGGQLPSVAERKRASVFILSYESVRQHLPWLTEIGAKTLIADEAQALKNLRVHWDSEKRTFVPGAKSPARANAFYELHWNIPKIIFSTGTPLMNRPKELFPYLHMCNKQEWTHQKNFEEEFCGGQETVIKGVLIWDANGRTDSAELHKRLKRYMVRHTKAMVAPQLAPKTRRSELITLSPEWRKEYLMIVRDFLKWVFARGGSQKAAAAERAHVLTCLTAMRHVAALGKVEAALDWITSFVESTGFRPLIVAGVHRDALDAIGTGIEKINASVDEAIANGETPVISRKIRWKGILGQTSLAQRKKIEEEFQEDGTIDVLLFSSPLGTGLTLTRSQDMLFIERMWRPSDQAQMEDRVHRLNQKNAVTITYLDADGTIDQRVAMLLADKVDAAAQIIDGVTLTDEQVMEHIFGDVRDEKGNKVNLSFAAMPQSMGELMEQMEIEAAQVERELEELVRKRHEIEKAEAAKMRAEKERTFAKPFGEEEEDEVEEDVREMAKKMSKGKRPVRNPDGGYGGGAALEADFIEWYPGQAEDHIDYLRAKQANPDIDRVLHAMVRDGWDNPTET